MTPRIAVLASGSGSNFQAIIDATESGFINGKVTILIASRPGIKAIERADKHGIPAKVINPNSFSSESEFESALIEALTDAAPDLIVLAGYLTRLPASVIRTWEGKIINIHPSLLPKYGGKGFYGLNVHRAVIENRESESGCSVHLVTEEFDEGPVLAQVKVPVLTDDTPESLAARIINVEHQLLVNTIAELLKPNETQPDL